VVGAEPAFGAEPADRARRGAASRAPGAARVAQGDRRSLGPIATDHDAVDDASSSTRRLHNPAAISSALRALGALRHGSRRRSSPRRARHARRCRTECGRSAVHHRTRPVIDAERVGADLRHRRHKPPGRHWSRPVTARPPDVSTLILVPSSGPSPPLSTKMPMPARPAHPGRAAA